MCRNNRPGSCVNRYVNNSRIGMRRILVLKCILFSHFEAAVSHFRNYHIEIFSSAKQETHSKWGKLYTFSQIFTFKIVKVQFGAVNKHHKE